MRNRVFALGMALALLGPTGGATADEIEFWHSFTQPVRIEAMEAIAAKFEDMTGTSVKIEVVPWSKVNEKWTAAAAAGTLPDVSICLPAICIAMNEAGVSRPMDEAVELIGGTDKFASEGLLNSFHTYKDQLISLPFYNHARLLFYRKDILDELGLEAPKTWEDYIDVAAKTSNPPHRYGMVQMWDPSDSGATQYLYLFIRSNGGAYLDGEGNSVFNTPENVEAVKQLLELYKAGSPEGEFSLTFHGNVFDLFTSGKSVMVFDTMFMTDAMKNKQPELYASGAVGVARPPARKQEGWYVGDVGITVMKGDNQAAADQWVAFLYRDENYIPFLHTIAGGMYPGHQVRRQQSRLLHGRQHPEVRRGCQADAGRRGQGVRHRVDQRSQPVRDRSLRERHHREHDGRHRAQRYRRRDGRRAGTQRNPEARRPGPPPVGARGARRGSGRGVRCVNFRQEGMGVARSIPADGR